MGPSLFQLNGAKLNVAKLNGAKHNKVKNLIVLEFR